MVGRITARLRAWDHAIADTLAVQKRLAEALDLCERLAANRAPISLTLREAADLIDGGSAENGVAESLRQMARRAEGLTERPRVLTPSPG